jgi:hypothetical protein
MNGTDLLRQLERHIHGNTVDWHRTGPRLPSSGASGGATYPESLARAIATIHYDNYLAWHDADDGCRGSATRPDGSERDAGRDERAHLESMAGCDELLIANEQGYSPFAAASPETFADLVDMISKLDLELYHAILSYDQGGDIERLNALVERYVSLKVNAAVLLDDMRSGVRHCALPGGRRGDWPGDAGRPVATPPPLVPGQDQPEIGTPII